MAPGRARHEAVRDLHRTSLALSLQSERWLKNGKRYVFELDPGSSCGAEGLTAQKGGKCGRLWSEQDYLVAGLRRSSLFWSQSVSEGEM